MQFGSRRADDSKGRPGTVSHGGDPQRVGSRLGARETRLPKMLPLSLRNIEPNGGRRAGE